MKTKIYFYTCIPCREDKHDDCEIGFPTPEGTGSEGSRCRCACHGKVEMSLEEQFKKIQENINYEW